MIPSVRQRTLRPATAQSTLSAGPLLKRCHHFDGPNVKIVNRRIPARRGGLFVAPRSLLRCLCEGPFVQYPSGKVACSRLTPVEELPMPDGYLHIAPRGLRPARPLPSRPVSPAFLAAGAGERPQSGMRAETAALEAEVAELERRLGYR
mmetsp:Transcript_86330/g.241435  ORF Transcript_86330/g.241435 Transcript_86330/m.241435 type:complete len:149 (+) Transcript_86330:57-503(+)